jgi:uncharacterized protein YjdB
MKRIFQILFILSALVIGVCSCKKDKDFIPISKVILNKATVTIPVGGTVELRANVYPHDATNKTIKWSSDNTSVATTSRNGLITGIAPGVTIIRVTDESGVVHYTDCAVSVHEAVVPVAGVYIGKSETTISVNGSETLNHTVAPSNATNKNVTWNSNNTSVVTVDNNGRITGIATGSATVTLTSEDGGFTSSCVITVSDEVIAVTGVSFNDTVLTVSVNGTGQLSATIVPENATNKNVTWSSNAVEIATVSADGLITGISAGTATVTATSEDGEFIATCEITVKEVTIPVTGVSLDKTAIDIYIGDEEQLLATVVPDNATNMDVIWSSDLPTVVTVSDAGVVTGIAAGTAIITATADSITATCTVTVKTEMGGVTSTGWSAPSSNSYEYSMTYVAQVAFRGILSTDVNTEVAAFVGDELRGYAKLIYEPKLEAYLINLVIYSNRASDETVILKAYNPAKERIYENCKEFIFHGDQSLGSSSEVLDCMP